MSNFAAVPSSLVTQTVGATAGGIGSSNIPGTANYAEGFVRDQSMVFTVDGTTPTATKGFQADAAAIILLRSREEITGYSGIRQGGTNATVDWTFYNRPPVRW